MDSRAYTYFSGKSWMMLSTTGQLCDVKGFFNSNEAITNILVTRHVIEGLNDDGTMYILILNEALLFGKSMEHLVINPNKIRSFGITESDNPFNRTQEFVIDYE